MYEIENKNLDFVIKELRRENDVCSEFKWLRFYMFF